MNQKSFYWIFLIALIGASLYIQTYNYDYTADDGIYSYFNRVTQKGLEQWIEVFKYGSMNFIEINPVNTSIYRPFTLLTFAIEHQIFGEFNARNGHILNIFLYFILLLILGKILVKLFERRELPQYIPILILGLYAVHPLHSEVVASVKSRDTLLASVFAFGAIWIWLRNENKLTILKKSGIGILFFLSLLSKEETITLSVVVAFIAYFFLNKNILESFKGFLIFLFPVIIYLLCRAFVLDSAATSYDSKINSILYNLNSGERFATNLFIYLKYIQLLVFPHPLSWDYSFAQLEVQTIRNPTVWVSALLFGGLIYIAIKGMKNRSLYSFGILFYLTTFSIFANLTQSLIIGSNVGERFMFIPSLGFCFLIVYAVIKFLTQFKIANFHLVSIFILVPIIMAFSWKTVDRSKVWKDPLSLSYSGIITAPRSWRTHVMYAEELRIEAAKLKESSPDSAQAFYKKAVVEYDKVYQILGKNAPVSQYLAPLAESLLGIGDTARAKVVLKESIKKQPDNHYSRFKLAAISYDEGNFELAKSLYLESLNAKKPNLYPTYKNLGLTYLRLEEHSNAISVLEKALEVQDDLEIRRNLAYLYSKLGDVEKAASFQSEGDKFSVNEIAFLYTMKAGNDAFQKMNYAEAARKYHEIERDFNEFGGIEKYPSFYAAYGKALIETFDTLSAKVYFLKAYKAEPTNSVVLTNLGTIAFLKDRNFLMAEKYFREAIVAGHEDLFSAHSNLGTVLIVQRREQEAIVEFEKSLKYGSSRPVLTNLYLLNKSLGNEERMKYYQSKLKN